MVTGEESPLEKSVSQPNISTKETPGSPALTPKTPRTGSQDSKPESIDELDTEDICETPMLSVTADGRLEMKRQLSVPDSTEEISADIDNALAEVVSGLKSLEMQQRSDKRMSLPTLKTAKVKAQAKHTPDLVLDLPEGSNSGSPQEGSGPDSPTTNTAADTFAQSNQGTLKKASSMPRGISGNTMGMMGGMSGSVGGDSHTALETHFLTHQPMLSTFAARRGANPNRSKSLQERGPIELSTSSPGAPVPVLPPLPSHMTMTHAPPPVADKPKPPIKVKPPVMKKPTRSPEVQRRYPPPVTAPPPQPHQESSK